MKTHLKKRIAIIGLGSIAQKAYLPVIANHSKVTPLFCTRNKEVLNHLADKYRVDACYTNIDDIIGSRPDAAMVHTATQSHFAIAKALLTANIPVFVDKPLCYTLKETEDLIQLAIKNQTPLFVGFNRRHAPLITGLKKVQPPTLIRWQKNRVNLPAEPRIFVLDDFIHVVDGLRFLTAGTIEQLQVIPQLDKGLLQSINVRWQQGTTLVSGSMNRMSGITEERLEYFANDQKWVVDELESGHHFHNEIQTPLKFDNWTSTLFKKGFEHMIETWLIALDGTFDHQITEDILETHRLCEQIVERISQIQK